MTRIGAAAGGFMTLSLVAASVLISGSSASARPANDDFANATPVVGSSVSTQVSTIGASIEAGEPTATGDVATARSASVWLRWTAPETTTVTISAVSEDISSVGLAVFDGAELSAGTETAFIVGGSLADVAVTKGASYSIQVSGVAPVDSASEGTVTVSLESADASHSTTPSTPSAPDKAPTVSQAPLVQPLSPPANDTYSGARRVAGPSWTTFVDNSSALVQSGEYTKIGDETSEYRFFNTVWLKWVAPQSGYVTVDTDGTSAVNDTAIAIFTGSSPSSSNRKAWNDQGAGLSGSGLSRINGFRATKGVVYYIQVGTSAKTQFTADGDSGIIVVNLAGVYTAPSNNNLVNAMVKTGSVWSSTVSDVGATIEPIWELTDNPDNPGLPPIGSQWWKWKPSSTALVSVNTEGSVDADTYIAIWDVDKYGTLSRVDFDDDSGTSSLSALTGVELVAGKTYYIQAGLVDDDRFNIFDTYGVSDYDNGTLRVNFSATYVGPAITKVSPSSGALAGGKTVKIYGYRLAGTTNVYFGNLGGTIVDNTHSSYVVVTTPAGISKKKVYVQVITPVGTSLIVTASHYTYN